MKIQELRNKLADAPREDVEKIAAELYKLLPKAKKEFEADDVIEAVLAHKDNKPKTVKDAPVDIMTLKYEIEAFLSNVDNYYYYEPNRIVPKSKRSKWRFEVKGYVKQLDKVPLDGEDSAVAAGLFRELYKRLCRGCGYYLFSSEDPFRALGITQPDFYERVISRSFALGINDVSLKNALKDATTVFLDRETLHEYMESVLVEKLPTSDSKYRAISIAMEMIDEMEESLKPLSKYSDRRYSLESDIDNLCDTILGISINLGEPDDAIKNYWLHDKSFDKEVTLYKLLRSIRYFGGGKELWIKVYENAVKVRKVKPRRELVEQYEKLKNNMQNK